MGWFDFLSGKKGKKDEGAEWMQKAAGAGRRTGLGAWVLGRYNDKEYRGGYNDATQQEVNKFDSQIKVQRTERGKDWARMRDRQLDRLDREYGLPSVRKQTSALRDQVRRAQNSGQNEKVRELSRMLDRSINKEAGLERMKSRRVREMDTHREKEDERYEFGVKHERQGVWDNASKQWHEGVPKMREQKRAQDRLEQMRGQQAHFGTPANQRLGSRQRGFLPPGSGGSSAGSSHASFTRPGSGH